MLVIATLATLFVSCGKKTGGGENEEVDLNVPYDTVATIKVGITTDPREKTFVEGLAESFNQIYPNVTVQTVQIAGDFVKEIGTRRIAEKSTPGTMPDIILSNSENAYTFISYGVFENLETYIDYEEQTNPEYKNQFYDFYMKLGQKNLDGDQYVLPRSADRVVTHINKAVLQEAGVDMSVVKNGWTWEDFLSVCQKVREHFDATGRGNKYIVDSYINWEAVAYPVFKSFGVEFFDKSNKVTLDSTETQSALNLMKELVDKKYIAPLNSDTSANFEGGQGAMLFHSVPVYQYYDLLGDDYDVVTFPLIGENPKIGAGLAGYGISSLSRYKAVSWKFLSYMLTKDGQDALAESGSACLPIRKDMADYTANKWGVKYGKLNMSAYSYKIEYNQATDLYIGFPASNQADIISAMSDLVTNYLRGDSYEKAISVFKKNINDLD